MSGHEAALAEIEAIVERGGDADDVLRSVLAAMHADGVAYASIRFVEQGELVDGPSIGEPAPGVTVPVTYEGDTIGELELAAEPPLAERVAALISPYVLVGWDTGGEPWG